MHDDSKRSAAVGKVARVEICGCGGSLVLALGCLSLRLNRETAADLAATLELALSLTDAGGPPLEPQAEPGCSEGTN
jgi:hypothetical protein